MEKLSVNLLGGIAFYNDNALVSSLPTRTEQALLVYLLYHNRPIPRDVLVSIFYPESDQTQGRKNLRTALTRIKSKIGDVLLVEREEISCRPDIAISTDTERFEAAMVELDATVSAETLQAILDSYHGDFMAGFYLRNAPEFEHWQIVMRERLRMVAVQGYERLLGQLENSAEFASALNCANRLLTIEPLMEHIHRAKMRLLARTGQASLALRHFEAASTLFDEELGTTLSEATHQLRSRIATLQLPPPAHLPAPRGSFVGRQATIADIALLLTDSAIRLVTLFGTGGMGKTRLAIQAGQLLHSERPGLFLDGVYFVDLTTVNSAESLIRAIAQTAGVSLKGQQPPREQLLTALHKREQLWILDNFEQLTDKRDAIDVIATLLKEATGVKLLVTSRAQLDLYEEHVFDVEGLTLPDEDDVQAVDASTQPDAVTLFLTVAQRRQRHIDMTDADLAIIARLCRLVEGSPLAIELAAGLLRGTTLAEIYARVTDSLSTLRTTLHNVPDRQRSMRAVFDYSWGLLLAESQTQLAALAIFPGDFAPEAAAAVAGADADALDQLVRRSLVESVGEGRFQLHSLLREFSAEKLQDHAAIAEKHAAYFHQALLERFDQNSPAAGIAWIQSQMADLLIAWHYLQVTRDLSRLHQLAHPIFIYFNNTGLWNHGYDLFEATASALVKDAPAFSAMLDARRATMMLNQGNMSKAAEVFAESLSILNAADETYEAVMTMVHLGYAYAELGEMSLALAYTEKSEALMPLIEDKGSVRVMHHVIGIVYRMAAEYEKARPHLEMVLESARANKDMVSVGLVLDSIGNLYRAMERNEEAGRYFREAKSVLEGHGATYHLSMVSVNLADVQALAGERDAAWASLQEAAVIARRTEDELDKAAVLTWLVHAIVRLGHFELAAELLVELGDLAQLYRLDNEMESVVLNSAEFFLKQQAWENANQHLCYAEQSDHISESGKQRAAAFRAQYADTLPASQPALNRDQLVNLNRSLLSE